MKDILDFGEFSEFNLPNETPVTNFNIYSIILRESLEGISENQKDQFEALVNRYQDIFSKNKHDLGYAKNVKHIIEFIATCQFVLD